MKHVEWTKAAALCAAALLTAQAAEAVTISDVIPVLSPEIVNVTPVSFLIDDSALAGISGAPVLTPGGVGFLVAPTMSPTDGFVIGIGGSTYLAGDYIESALDGDTMTVLFSNEGGTGSGSFAGYLLMTLTGATTLPTDGPVMATGMTITGGTVSAIPLPASVLGLVSALGLMVLGGRRKNA